MVTSTEQGGKKFSNVRSRVCFFLSDKKLPGIAGQKADKPCLMSPCYPHIAQQAKYKKCTEKNIYKKSQSLTTTNEAKISVYSQDNQIL